MELKRVRQPPGGETNDIFHMEERQRCQRSEFLTKQVSENEKEELNIPSSSKAVENLGLFDMKRVRKPPGGDTNDIFGMESRQKSDAMKLQKQINEKKKNSIPVVTEQVSSLPPLSDELDKENLTTPDQLVCDEETNLKVKLLEEDEEVIKPSPKKYYRHNTITGEVEEMNVQRRHKLKDCSNVSEQEEKPTVHRSNIRVRQPPGGTSNIFF